MQPGVVLAAIAGSLLVWAMAPLNRFNMTSQKAKNWYTLRAALHVLMLHKYWDKARDTMKEISGACSVTSAYRSPKVNDLVGGVKNSDHVKGLACDFVGKKGKRRAGVKAIVEKINNGELGPVRQCIWESYKGVLHLGYYGPGRSGKCEFLEQYKKGKHRRLELT